MNPTQTPDFRKVSCYRLSNGFVWVNMAEISSCERAFQGGEAYFARLVMKGGREYYISEADYDVLFPGA